MKKMNKPVSILLALVLCLSLTACGKPDKQPAIEAFNKASAAFNEVSAIINQNPEAYEESFVDTMIEWAGLLNDMKSKLDGNDLNQDDLDKVTSYCKDVEQWAVDAKAILNNN